MTQKSFKMNSGNEVKQGQWLTQNNNRCMTNKSENFGKLKV
jgi:hypothetical protein